MITEQTVAYVIGLMSSDIKSNLSVRVNPFTVRGNSLYPVTVDVKSYVCFFTCFKGNRLYRAKLPMGSGNTAVGIRCINLNDFLTP